MKIAAFILFGLQALSIFGSITSGQFFDILFGGFFYGVMGFSRTLGYFLPTIIGIVLLVRHEKKQNAKNCVSSEDLAKDPSIQVWVCAKCKTNNLMKVKTCQKCGVSKQWSDEQQKASAPAVQTQFVSAEAGETTVLSAPEAGQTTVLSAPEAGQTTVLNESGYLKLRTSLNSELKVSKTMCAVGTAAEADLNLSQLPCAQYISGRHALLVYSGGAWYIRDENSANGTQLNGYPLEAQLYYPLAVDSVISLAGKEHLTVVELA